MFQLLRASVFWLCYFPFYCFVIRDFLNYNISLRLNLGFPSCLTYGYFVNTWKKGALCLQGATFTFMNLDQVCCCLVLRCLPT